jgi:hypothetical protein
MSRSSIDLTKYNAGRTMARLFDDELPEFSGPAPAR